MSAWPDNSGGQVEIMSPPVSSSSTLSALESNVHHELDVHERRIDSIRAYHDATVAVSSRGEAEEGEEENEEEEEDEELDDLVRRPAQSLYIQHLTIYYIDVFYFTIYKYPQYDLFNNTGCVL